MRLRTFIAANMAEAIAAVRRELGPDAIIVSNFTNESGSVEVTAALETGADRRASLPDLEASLEHRLRDRLRLSPEPDRHSGHRTDFHSGLPFDETLIARSLDAQGVPTDLRDDLVSSASALDNNDAVAALASALELRLDFAPVPPRPRYPLMLVGLPGSGKTVTMAKLAAAALIDGANVDLVTTDTIRAGAAEQGEAYGRLLEVPLRAADSVDALSLVLEENGPAMAAPDHPRRHCFIDTGSVNPFDAGEFAALKRLADAARLVAEAEPVLVLSAAGDARFLSEIASHFASLGVRRLIATQVDISRRIGAVLAAADEARLSLAQISVTPYLARGLAPMNPFVCARLILGPHERQNEAGKAATAS